jgi:hypothetical protein
MFGCAGFFADRVPRLMLLQFCGVTHHACKDSSLGLLWIAKHGDISLTDYQMLKALCLTTHAMFYGLWVCRNDAVNLTHPKDASLHLPYRDPVKASTTSIIGPR